LQAKEQSCARGYPHFLVVSGGQTMDLSQRHPIRNARARKPDPTKEKI